jgi:hypothetical protein
MLDLKMVVRFEIDACLSTSKGPSVPKTKTASVDDLTDALGGMAIKKTASPSSSSSSPTINIVRAGTQVPQEALVEVTSRSAYFIDQLDWNEIYPQLALSQTPALHLGVHERGVFSQLHEWQIDGEPPAGTRTSRTHGRARYLGAAGGDGGTDRAPCEGARRGAGARYRAGPRTRGQLQSGVRERGAARVCTGQGRGREELLAFRCGSAVRGAHADLGPRMCDIV